MLFLLSAWLVPAQLPCCGTLAPMLDAANASAALISEMLTCTDNNAACASWAAAGECTRNVGFMRAECRRACKNCALSQEDALGASEAALMAVRSFALACKHGSAPEAEVCELSLANLPKLRAGHEDASGLAITSSLVRGRVSAVCADSNQCLLGTGAHPLPPALQLQRPPPAASATRSERFFTLRGGVRLPAIGLGTWLMTGAECTDMVAAGLRAGLRHIDTSENYANHAAIGTALKASNVPRAELFLADKISLPTSYSTAGVRAWVTSSLAMLGTDYLDLLMLHSVGPSPAARREAWREMERLKSEGIVRAIGVSNFGTAEISELRREANEPPVTHQTKYNPYHAGRTNNANAEDFKEDCAVGGCVLVAYCPLNAWPSKLAPINDRYVAALAAKYGKTPAQVLLRWVVHTGAAALTRSRSESRLAEAVAALDFDLSDDDVKLISGLGWLVESMMHRPASSVEDVLGVAQLQSGSEARDGPRGEQRVEL